MSLIWAEMHGVVRGGAQQALADELVRSACWAARKGLAVLACGGMLNPARLHGLTTCLVPDEKSGLLRLDETLHELFAGQHALPYSAPLFLLQGSVLCREKLDGRRFFVRHLLYMPDAASVWRLLARLGLESSTSTEPRLELSSRELLDLVLEIDARSVLVPAHLWAAKHSLFGGPYAFASLEDCFGPLSRHLFAVDGGFESTPQLNRLWSGLDRVSLIASSHAPAGPLLGNQATAFTGEASYDGLFEALRRAAHGEKPRSDCVFYGTAERFAELESLYLDGHKACGLSLHPAQSLALESLCPVCGKPLEKGTLHRILERADRLHPPVRRTDPVVHTGISLGVLAAQVAEQPGEQRVRQRLGNLLAQCGPELYVLHEAPLPQIAALWPRMAEALGRMRSGHVRLVCGYGGQPGTARFFAPSAPDAQTEAAERMQPAVLPASLHVHPKALALMQDERLAPLSYAQAKIVAGGQRAACIQAGPGTGKSHTLVARLLAMPGSARWLLLAPTQAGVEHVKQLLLARKAPPESMERVHTPLSLALYIVDKLGLHSENPQPAMLAPEEAMASFIAANAGHGQMPLAQAWQSIYLCGHAQRPIAPDMQTLRARYSAALQARGHTDSLHSLEAGLACLGGAPVRARELLGELALLCVDDLHEYSALELALCAALRAVVPDVDFLASCDMNQRTALTAHGADPLAFLSREWPGCVACTLTENYCQGKKLVDAAQSLSPPESSTPSVQAMLPREAELVLHKAPDKEQEALWLVDCLRGLLLPKTGAVSGVSPEALRSQIAPLSRLYAAHGPYRAGECALIVPERRCVSAIVALLDKAGIASRSGRTSWGQKVLSHNPDTEDAVHIATFAELDAVEAALVFLPCLGEAFTETVLGSEADTGRARQTRLLYKAFTRARDAVFVSFVPKGAQAFAPPVARFLKQLEQHAASIRLARHTRRISSPLSLL